MRDDVRPALLYASQQLTFCQCIGTRYTKRQRASAQHGMNSGLSRGGGGIRSGVASRHGSANQKKAGAGRATFDDGWGSTLPALQPAIDDVIDDVPTALVMSTPPSTKMRLWQPGSTPRASHSPKICAMARGQPGLAAHPSPTKMCLSTSPGACAIDIASQADVTRVQLSSFRCVLLLLQELPRKRESTCRVSFQSGGHARGRMCRFRD